MSAKEIFASQSQHAKEKKKYVKDLYKARLKDGWTLGQIDEMDIHFYFSLYIEETDTIYIDQIDLF